MTTDGGNQIDQSNPTQVVSGNASVVLNSGVSFGTYSRRLLAVDTPRRKLLTLTGDANGDGTLDANDVLYVQKMALQLVSLPFDATQRINAAPTLTYMIDLGYQVENVLPTLDDAQYLLEVITRKYRLLDITNATLCSPPARGARRRPSRCDCRWR